MQSDPIGLDGDNAGNTTGFGGITFAYNNRGRMKSSTNDGVTTQYLYNALGQLIKKGSSTLYYYDDAGHILGTYSASGALIEEIVWLGDTPIASLRPKDGGGIGIYNIHADHLNTPRLITDAVDSSVRWRWDGEPFGGGTVDGNPSGVGEFEFDLRFPGQMLIAETGLYYNYFRDGYDSATGRYTQSDPIGLAGGINTYAYVSGNAVNLVDPLGLAECRYSISRHTLECRSSKPRPKGRRPSFSISGEGVFSGLGQCTKNPAQECQDSQDLGPVPEGPYKINRHESRTGFWRLESIPPVRAWEFKLGLKRNGFMIHPGTVSLGCITVDKYDEKLMQDYESIDSLLQREDGRNTLEVVP